MPVDSGPSLVARAFVVLVTVLVATSTVAMAVTAAAPGGAAAADANAEIDTGVGDTTTFDVDENDTGSTTPIDVVFVVDSSESMNTERYELAAEMQEFQRTLLDKGVDARFGLVTYTDTARVRQPMTDDFSKVESAMQFSPQGNVEEASNALMTASGMDFRSDAKTVYVLMTDEDDDSSISARQQALSTVRDDVFIAVSPGDVGASGCDDHYEPCDNSTTNELKRYASQVGGDWIDIQTEAPETMRQVASSVAGAAGASTDVGDGSDSTNWDLAPEISVKNASTDRTTVEVGETVTVNATLENEGFVDGSVEVEASANGTALTNETVTVERLSERSVTLEYAFEESGVYTVVLNNQRVAEVTVRDIKPTEVSVETSPAEDRVVAEVSEARAGEQIEITPSSSSLLSLRGGDLSGVTITTEPGIETPAHDVEFELSVAQRTTAPSETAALPTDANAVTYLSVTSTLGDSEISSVSFQFADTTTDVTMYRFDRESGSWTKLSKQQMGDGDGMLAANTSELSWFAVAVNGPIVSVESVETGSTEITAGDLVTGTVELKNYGSEQKTYEVPVSLDGQVVHTKEVTLEPDETKTVSVAYAVENPGEYSLSVGGVDQGTLQVSPDGSMAGDGDEATETTTDDATTAPDGSTPGFTPIVALLAVLLVAALGLRRRR